MAAAKIVRRKMVRYPPNIMQILLSHLRPSAIITEAVLEASAQHYNATDLMRLLLPYGKDKLEVTEAVLTAVLQSNAFGHGEMKGNLFTLRRNDTISEAVLIAAAVNDWDGERHMRMLVHLKGHTRLQITEAVLLKALESGTQGPEILRFLLHECDDLVDFPDGRITPVILEAAANNPRNAPKLLQVILDYRKSPLIITKSVIIAASNGRSWRRKLKILCSVSDEARQICRSMGGHPKIIADEVV